jgi:3(or 17)beta-hydroxysteroid dehydrogenase
MRLGGKIALVTGAGRGIGAAISEIFAREGARVWITDIDGDAAERVARRIGAGAQPLRLEDGAAQDVETASLADWRAVLTTNLDGVFLGCQMAIRTMRPGGGGSIVNVASRSGHVGIPTAAAYAASKSAVLNHTRSVALYCAERDLRIRCNSISPAAILTPMWEPMLGVGLDRPARMAAIVADTPLRRFGDPAEVAALAVLLASDEARYMTGADLTLDGGLLAGAAARPEAAS